MNFQITIQEFGGDDLRITNQISLSKFEMTQYGQMGQRLSQMKTHSCRTGQSRNSTGQSLQVHGKAM